MLVMHEDHLMVISVSFLSIGEKVNMAQMSSLHALEVVAAIVLEAFPEQVGREICAFELALGAERAVVRDETIELRELEGET